LGDQYIIALAAGLKRARMIEKCYMASNRITDLGLTELVHNISPEITVLDLSHNKITIVDKKLLEMIIEPEYRL
jgi:NLR family CARD domain-containing protein 3